MRGGENEKKVKRIKRMNECTVPNGMVTLRICQRNKYVFFPLSITIKV